MDRSDSHTRTTRSRSRSMHPSNGNGVVPPPVAVSGRARDCERTEEKTLPASAAATVGASSRKSHAASSVAAPHVAAPSPSPSPSASPPSQMSAYARQLLEEQYTGNGGKDYFKAANKDEFYWCQGEPTLRKVAAHLDTLTTNDHKLTAAHGALSESIQALNGTVAALLDSNHRLRREVARQKIASARRWIAGALVLFFLTLGREFLVSVVMGFIRGVEDPSSVWPGLLQSIHLMSIYGWLLAVPLTLALFVHSMINAFSAGRMSLTRFGFGMALGVGMQLPLLSFIARFGWFYLDHFQSSPLFEASWANDLCSVLVWLGVALLDYTLLVMHGYVN